MADPRLAAAGSVPADQEWLTAIPDPAPGAEELLSSTSSGARCGAAVGQAVPAVPGAAAHRRFRTAGRTTRRSRPRSACRRAASAPPAGRCLDKMRALLADPGEGKHDEVTRNRRASQRQAGHWTMPTSRCWTASGPVPAGRPMPADLPERVRFSLAMRDLEFELARLVRRGRRADAGRPRRGAEPDGHFRQRQPDHHHQDRCEQRRHGADRRLARPAARQRPIEMQTTAENAHRRQPTTRGALSSAGCPGMPSSSSWPGRRPDGHRARPSSPRRSSSDPGTPTGCHLLPSRPGSARQVTGPRGQPGPRRSPAGPAGRRRPAPGRRRPPPAGRAADPGLGRKRGPAGSSGIAAEYRPLAATAADKPGPSGGRTGPHRVRAAPA